MALSLEAGPEGQEWAVWKALGQRLELQSSSQGARLTLGSSQDRAIPKQRVSRVKAGSGSWD